MHGADCYSSGEGLTKTLRERAGSSRNESEQACLWRGIHDDH